MSTLWEGEIMRRSPTCARHRSLSHQNRRSLRRLALVTVGLLGVSLGMAIPSSALTIYAYTGNNFDTIFDQTPPAGTYTTSMSVTGSLTLSAPLAPNLSLVEISGSLVGYSFDDGRNTLTDANSTHPGLFLSTDALGNITEWQLTFSIPYPASPPLPGYQAFFIQSVSQTGGSGDGDIAQVLECVTPQGIKCVAGVDTGEVFDNPGTWTLVPEPSTVLLLASGLVGLAARRRRLD